MKFKENTGIDLRAESQTGITLIKVVILRSRLRLAVVISTFMHADFNKVTDKSDQVNLKPHEIGVVKYSPGRSKMMRSHSIKS